MMIDSLCSWATEGSVGRWDKLKINGNLFSLLGDLNHLHDD